jgi:ribosomal protein S12 methylthiotransferase accessory factor
MTPTAAAGQTPTVDCPADSPAKPAAPKVGFKRHLKVEVARDDKVYLFGERGLTVLAGSSVSTVAPLLDGSRDLPALQAATGLGDDQLTGVLARLAELGVLALRRTRSAADEAALAYWDGAGMDAVEAAASVAGSTVQVIGVGDVDTERAGAALLAAGLNVAGQGAPAEIADLSIVLCADYLDPRLADVDAAHRQAGRPWLLAKPVGAIIWLGPVFQPTTAGCWHCLEQPLSRHRNAESCAQEALGHGVPVRCPDSSVPALTSVALNLVALEAAKWLAGYRHQHQSSVWTFDSLDLSGRHHALRARPQCPVCGDPDLIRAQARKPVTLRSECRIADSAGGHRALSAERVRERYQHLVSPVTGIVKEIRRDDHGPAFFNSFRSGANVAAKARSLDALRTVLRNSNGGKGTTALQAEVGALCEAAERYSGSFHGDEERIRGSLRSLGEQAIHPNDCQLFDERQYRTRTEWNAQHSPFQFVGEPFTDTTVADWTPVWSLTQQRHRLLPTGLLYFGAPTAPGQAALFADSNGNAAGSSLEDAVLQGLFEVVERDAVALWWYNRSRVAAVDLAAFTDPWIDELRTVYAGLRRDVWVLDVTSDIGVPTMVAVSRRTDSATEDVMFGFGAHLDPRIALRRALTELNQLMPAVLKPGAGRDYACDDPDAVRWWQQATVANQPYLSPDPGRAPLRLRDYDYAPCDDIRAEVGLIQQRLEARGLDLLVLDQTRPDIDLPVVKVIVPGMRHFWARLAPGRLYDVPVALGRRSAPTGYDDLNPHPMFL